MEAGIELDPKSLSDVLSKFEFAKFAQSKYFTEAMQESLVLTQANIDIRTPVGTTGNLKASISSQLITDIMGVSGIVSSPLNYAPAVEMDTKPHFPPIFVLTGRIEGLDLWAKQKGLSPFAVAKTIARKGTKGKHMFKQGLMASKANVYTVFIAKAKQFMESLRTR